ncbi:hypothetical protein BSKO_00695 [Bryopsis sp. KO-2023]|nr:hypothetical protein BSKO_00695 [Bryopsis sp. KO-2023]
MQEQDCDILNSLDLTFEDFTDKLVIGKGKNERVAIKAYDRHKLSTVKMRSVRREARMMRCLTTKQIPNTTRFYGAFQDTHYIYIVMEYCPKGDLLELLIREGRAMTEKRICNMVAIPLLTTLQHMHRMGMIHRDIKLENVFVDEDLHVKLGDFGLTMSIHEERAISPVGTVEYMAPELVKLPSVDKVLSGQFKVDDIVPVTEKVDIWALGVTCFELVSGKVLSFSFARKVSSEGLFISSDSAVLRFCVYCAREVSL